MKRLTSAIAVKFPSHNVFASSSFVLPVDAICFSSQYSPVVAWLFDGSNPGPRECLEVTSI